MEAVVYLGFLFLAGIASYLTLNHRLMTPYMDSDNELIGGWLSVGLWLVVAFGSGSIRSGCCAESFTPGLVVGFVAALFMGLVAFRATVERFVDLGREAN